MSRTLVSHLRGVLFLLGIVPLCGHAAESPNATANYDALVQAVKDASTDNTAWLPDPSDMWVPSGIPDVAPTHNDSFFPSGFSGSASSATAETPLDDSDFKPDNYNDAYSEFGQPTEEQATDYSDDYPWVKF